MDYFMAFICIFLCLIGIAGCIIPAIPGLPLNYISFILLYFNYHSFTKIFLFVWLGVVIIVTLLDYYIPLWFSKRYGATRSGIVCSIIGMFAGMFLTPVGMIAGTIIGAIIGDLLAGKTQAQAMRSGLATFIGTLSSIGLKLITSGIMTWYTIKAIIHYF